MVGERGVTVTHEDIYNLCNQILSEVKTLNQRQIDMLRRIETKLENIYEGIKTLSDNQVVIDEHIQEVKGLIEDVRDKVNQLLGLLPGR